jgi:hypothetical protein
MRDNIAMGVCWLSGLGAAIALHFVGHPERVCLGLFPVWFVTAEWLGGRLPFIVRTLPEIHSQTQRGALRMRSTLARLIWWASMMLAASSLVLLWKGGSF